jgi:hypothetical protein
MIMSFSMLPILLFIQMVVLFRTFSKIERDGKISSEQKGQLNMILWAMIFWGAFSAYLGMNGYFTKESFLSSLPGLWITQIPVFIVMIPWVMSKSLRGATDAIIDHIPLHYIMVFEGLRVLAIGGVMKGFRGEFSLFFAKAVAIPDFLYGVLTLITAVLIYRGVWKEKSAIIVNLIGFVILVPGAMVLMNFSLPGSLNMIQESPNLSAIFEFPMSMAPTIVVPIFAIINLFTIVRLTQRALLKNKKSTKEQIAVPI